MDIKISIIIPVYNGEKYLRDSIESITKNTFDSLEIILVDDGSTDKSKAICEYYVQHDNRVSLISQRNMGICEARNNGIDFAKGEYILFVDQDDKLKDGAIDVLIKYLENRQDMIIGGKEIQVIAPNKQIISEKIINYSESIVEKKEIYRKIFNLDCDQMLSNIWNCLYRTEIIKANNLRFHNKLRMGHEDTLFNNLYVSHCEKIIVIPKVLYEYHRRIGYSISTKKNKTYIEDLDFFLKEMNKNISSEIVCNYTRYYGIRVGCNWFVENMYGLSHQKCIEDLRYINEICNRYDKNNNGIAEISDNKIRVYVKWISFLLDKKKYNLLLLFLWVKYWILNNGKRKVFKREFIL